jgi:hypothetical protein
MLQINHYPPKRSRPPAPMGARILHNLNDEDTGRRRACPPLSSSHARSELRQQPRQAAGSDPPFFPRTLAARMQSYAHFATLHSGLFGGRVAEFPKRGVSLRAPTAMGALRGSPLRAPSDRPHGSKGSAMPAPVYLNSTPALKSRRTQRLGPLFSIRV